jgi:hypothetical protein
VKAFFIVTLVISIVFPFFEEFTGVLRLAHNQSARRPARLTMTSVPKLPSAHLGLTEGQLAGVDGLFAEAYRDSVGDGGRISIAYDMLRLQALGVDAVLFVASLIGLRACRSSGRLTMRSSQPLTGKKIST